MKKSLVIIIVGLLWTGLCWSQDQSEMLSKKQFPLEVSFVAHAVSMPFDGIIMSPLHPGFTLGTEYAYSEGKIGRLFLSLHGGYFNHEFSAKAFFVQTGVGYRYTFGFGFFADTDLDLGYLHSYHPTEIFAQNAQGEYEQVKDRGKAGFMISLALGLGYDFSKKLGWPVSLFFRFQPFIQTPYSQETSVFPQSFVHIGLRVQL
ncbi:hypothetical protein ACFLQZ_01595 [Acidobacteriota bacterium]